RSPRCWGIRIRRLRAEVVRDSAALHVLRETERRTSRSPLRSALLSGSRIADEVVSVFDAAREATRMCPGVGSDELESYSRCVIAPKPGMLPVSATISWHQCKPILSRRLTWFASQIQQFRQR